MAALSGRGGTGWRHVAFIATLIAVCLAAVAAPLVHLILAHSDAPTERAPYPVRFAIPDPHAAPPLPLAPAPGFTTPVTKGLQQLAETDDVENSDRDAAISPKANSNFADEFASLDNAPTTEPRRARPLAIDYDLVAASRPAIATADGSTIEVAKKLTVNGADAGSVRLKIGDGTQVWMASSDLVRIASQGNNSLMQNANLWKDKQFVSFSALRAGGLTVRYDPATDRVEIAS